MVKPFVPAVCSRGRVGASFLHATLFMVAVSLPSVSSLIPALWKPPAINVSLPNPLRLFPDIIKMAKDHKVAPDVLVAADVSGVKITTTSGEDLIGRFFTPTLGISDEVEAPAVLLLHGIPGTEQNYDVAYALRDVGINCLLFHYRGCWGSPGNYSIRNLEDDIEAALLWLRSQPTVNKEKLVVVGHSLGGYHTLRLAISSVMANSTKTKLRPAMDEALQGVRGYAALCPLVGTDTAGVPLPKELSSDFAAFLNGVSAAELREQWGELEPVASMLARVRDLTRGPKTISKLADGEPILIPGDGDGVRKKRLTKAELMDAKKAAEAERRAKVSRGKPLLIITGDVDPLFSQGYYREHLIKPLEEVTAFKWDWMKKPQGDHGLCRYRQELVEDVVGFVCTVTGHCRWTMGERVASAAQKGILLVPWFTLAGMVMGILMGRTLVWDEFEDLKRELTGLPPRRHDREEEEEEEGSG